MRKDVWLLVALLCGACPGGAQVKSGDFAVSERLRDEDCLTASELYKQRLAVPRRAGSIVSSRLTVRSEEAQAADLFGFVGKCQTQLAGRARRAIVRCWQDSTDAETFDSCNDRF